MYIHILYIHNVQILRNIIHAMSTRIGGSDIWIHTCNRCQEKWTSVNKDPGTCAKCRSPYWNKKRVMKK